MIKAIDYNNHDYNLKLGISYQFTRKLPETSQTAKSEQFKSLNLTFLPDCNTGK